MILNDATRAQVEAAHPDASTWLGANAGSGKTRVLTDRVARLLLSGVRPENILCLTYTKAAASEMQNRLFKRLGAWAMLPDTRLRQEMAELGVEGDLDTAHLARARTLFALAIETPGGLKIQTIHSFCAALLRRFPLEAGVSPQFTEIEDRAADLLRAEIVDDMADGPDAPLVAGVARLFAGEDFDSLTRSIVEMREQFGALMSTPDLLACLGQPKTLTRSSIEASVFLGEEEDLIAALIPRFLASSANDQKVGRALSAIDQLNWGALSELDRLFVYGPDTTKPLTPKFDRVPTQPLQKTIGPLLDPLHALMQRVADAQQPRLALMAAEKSAALHAFARSFLARYAAAKEARGWLDFDDLILRARALLTDRAVAAWVLYRIDGGIEHVLVDEAQDTSPRQWDVIERLTDAFYDRTGTHRDRTLFVVGDKKQSIYSFQGADPLEFDRKSLSFEERFTSAGQVFQHQSLDYSFRSSSAILRFVDTVFDPNVQPEFAKLTNHIAFKVDLPGRVDLWPVIESTEAKEDRPWTDPLDRLDAQNHFVQLAKKIAAQIKELTNGAHFIPDDDKGGGGIIKRPIRPGDFLILVQRRSKLFGEIIRACKALELPIAGADRLKVGAEIAVRDIGALLSFLATPGDDLSLAVALKSPLFGWSEQQLFDLAHKRQVSSLSRALRERGDEFADTLETLNDLRGQVDFLRPYDLIERILTRHDGRKKLLARLGPEAEDGINALLTQALAYERNDVPSLTGFIEWMQTDDLQIKRQIDSATDQIRVMTVHGSKGLEAPIVILPETEDRRDQFRKQMFECNGVPHWKPPSGEVPAVLRTAMDQITAADQAERLRLLYVALTRAEKWLIIAAAGKVTDKEGTWYQMASDAMDRLNGVTVTGSGTRRFQEGDWDGLQQIGCTAVETIAPVLEPVFAQKAPLHECADGLLSPSNLGGAKALPGEEGANQEAAMAYGSLVHDLLEKLPGLSPDLYDGVLRSCGAERSGLDGASALAEVRQVLADPTLSFLFEAVALTEVPITGTIGNARLSGVVDRLLISETTVLLVDYKTNRVVPETPQSCPEGILRQMGAYAHLLRDIYPDHEVQSAILWTVSAQLMHLPHDLVTEALWRSPHLDAASARS